jgi:hypothetical protein
VPDVGADLGVGDLGQRAGGDDRGADGTEGDRGGVGQEHDGGGAQGAEAQGHEHDAGDRHGGTEAGQRLEQTTEAEGDDDRLDPRVVGDEVERRPQVLEPAAHDGDLVEHDRREDDPHDREEAEDGALGGRQHGQPGGHPEEDHRDEDGHPDGGEPGPVRLPPQPPERDEDGDQREQGHQSGADEAAAEWGQIGFEGICGDGERGNHAGLLEGSEAANGRKRRWLRGSVERSCGSCL